MGDHVLVLNVTYEPLSTVGWQRAVVLVLSGIAFKIGAFPFQIWIPDVYQGAPTPVTALLAVGSKAAGFAILLNLTRTAFAPYAALKFAQPGDVLVVAVDGNSAASVIGDVLLGMARNAGIVAAVTDGMVRDIAGIDEVGIPVFAQGLSPNSPFKDGPGEIGGAITLGGTTVRAGDLVVGDIDGVVVVPRAPDRSGRCAVAVACVRSSRPDAHSTVSSAARGLV